MSTPNRFLPMPELPVTHARFQEAEPSLIRVEFAWGTLVERRSRQFVIWDFFLVPLRHGVRDAGSNLDTCQWLVFQELERCFSCTTRDVVTLLERLDTWALFPGFTGTFTQVVHVAWEREARRWVVNELFPALPNIIDQARQRFQVLAEEGRRGCQSFES